MTETAIDSFVAKLVQAYPELPVARLFLSAALRERTMATECLLHELMQTTLHVHEPVVVGTKLRWWQEECERLNARQGRHPISLPLQESAATIDVAACADLVLVAMSRHSAPPPADFAAQRAQVEPVFTALADIEASALGQRIDTGATARARGLSYLFRETARAPVAEDDDPLGLPLNRLARHQLTRPALREDTVARNDACREQLADLASAMDALDVGRCSYFTRLRLRMDRRRIAAILKAPRPFPAAWEQLNRSPLSAVWTAWREARR
ncbi:hypothetical protein [Tahibacter amnicola]|uniref:Phytoene synthase n=1 Tax=Tahibacter amnicola TaxID=2976241 RepID=A0ABY6BJU6_9GAMM|nr:hypothetical protein [Tahibacter amnicola]UXI70037.1 hypothetical protein N4264_10530 [Tahibacter amnicola]